MKTTSRSIIALVIFFILSIMWLIGITLLQETSFRVHEALASPSETQLLTVDDKPYIAQAEPSQETTVKDNLTITPAWQELVPEIQQHLGNRPLAAYSEEIAQACYNSGMSPYWFCTIAITESGGGANCFRSHNAWGYGNYSWSSWEESIPAFTELFVAGYGSGLNSSSHLRYCPGGAYYPYI